MLNIAVISPSTTSLEQIGTILRNAGHAPQMLHLIEGGMSRLRSVVEKNNPDLVVLDSMCRDTSELGELEVASALHPQLVAVMLCANQTPDFLLQAMRAGVREVLSSPVSPDALLGAIGRIEQKRGVTRHEQHAAKVFAFIPCKGGSGATFLAANTAYQMAAQSRKVLLIDLNLQFGEAVLYLHDNKPRTTLADLSRNIQRLDPSFLAASVVQVTPLLSILPAPEDPGQAMEVRPEHVEALLDLAVGMFDIIVLDIGRSLDAVTIKALDKADRIFPVMQMTLPFIRDAHRLLTVFRSLGYPQEKIEIIVNRYERGGEITLDDVQKSLGCERPHLVPNNYSAVAASVNHGRPMLEMARSNPVTKALQEFVDSKLPKKEEQSGWLGRLMRRDQRA